MSLVNLAHLANATDNDPDDTWAQYRTLIDTAVDNQPRTLQARIGPSEIGNPCDACLISKLAGIPEARETGTSWLPFVGTAVHEQLEVIFAAANAGMERARYLVETTVSVGEIAGQDITGHADLYDTHTGEVTDWKIVGITTLRDVKRNGIPDAYRAQVHLYGRGFTRRGLPCRGVRIAFLPRNSRSLTDAIVCHETYDEQVALDALGRADTFAQWIAALGADELLKTAIHNGGHSCARYGHIDPDAAKRASAAFSDLVA
jgi:hypothetical protein